MTNNKKVQGQAYGLFPTLEPVSGSRLISQQIITLLLVRPGEDYIHSGIWRGRASKNVPPRGIAPPDLFTPMSHFDSSLWIYQAEREIARWIPGISKLYITTHANEERGHLNAEIQFQTKQSPDVHVLTFDFTSYEGVVAGGDTKEFLQSLQLDNSALFIGW